MGKVQLRIAKYNTLLDNIIKNTPKNHPDTIKLKEAIKIIKQKHHEINNDVKLNDEKQKLVDMCKIRKKRLK